MPALSAMLLVFSFQFSLLFFHVKSQAAAAAKMWEVHSLYVVYSVGE